MDPRLRNWLFPESRGLVSSPMTLLKQKTTLRSADYILRESQTTQNVLWSLACVCLSVCLSVYLCVCPRPYAHTTARTRM